MTIWFWMPPTEPAQFWWPQPKRVGASGRVVGIDLSAAMLDRAASAVDHASLTNVELRLGDAERLELGTGTADIVLCAFGISAFSKPERALLEFRRVRRPGGRLGIVDTFGWYFQHDARWRRLAEVLRAFGVNMAVATDDASDWLVARYHDHAAQIVRLYVSRPHRRHGVGRALLNALIRFVESQDFHHQIMLHTDPRSPGVEAFWRSQPTTLVHDDRDGPSGSISFEIDRSPR